jgi:hypothetical protein
VREELKFPGDTSTPASIDGTHSHTLLEHCLKTDTDARQHIGTELTDHDGTFTVDDDRAARVQLALDYVDHRLMDLGIDAVVLTESRVNPSFLVSRDDMSGTADVQIRTADFVEVIDYKDGVGVVEVVGNPQLEQYALGVLAEFRVPRNFPHPVKKMRLTVIQPRNAVRGLPTLSSWDVDADYILRNVGDAIVLEGAATDQPDAPLVPGDKQCRWCKARGSCAARSQAAIESMSMVFPVVTAPAEPAAQVLDVAQQAAAQDPGSMSDVQLRQLLEAAPVVRRLLDDAETEVHKRLMAGVPVPGFKLVNGRGSRAWSIGDDDVAEKLVKMGVPKSAVYETKVVSPAKVEKLTWEKRDGTKVSLSPRQLKTIETEYVTKMAGKPTVAPESDSRPAVVVNAAPLFSAVPEVAPAAESLPSWLSV